VASLEEMRGAADTGMETVEKALDLIQSFDPIGVGARNVAECLLLQLRALNLKDTIVEKIIMNNMDELENKKYQCRTAVQSPLQIYGGGEDYRGPECPEEIFRVRA
jgi:RNA polymerase sigma-54 factor